MNVVKFWYGIILIVCLCVTTKAWAPPKFIELDQWGLNPIPSFKRIPMPSIPRYVVITDTDTQICPYNKYCLIFLNYIVNYESFKNVSESIAAHFYIGGDGNIYEGRGWDFVGGNNFGCEDNTSIIEISFIGNFKSSIFSIKQFRAVQKLIKFGIKSGKLSKAYKLLGGWQLSDEIIMSSRSNIEIIETWPHWTANKPICSDGFSNFIPIIY